MDIIDMILAKATNGEPLAYAKKQTLTFDGDATGKENMLGEYVKISDLVVTPNDVKQVVQKILTNGEVSSLDQTDNLSWESFEFEGLPCYIASVSSTPFIIVLTKDGLFEDMEYHTAGTYTVCAETDAGKTWISLIETETIHPIDPKFIPALDSLTLNSPSGKQYKVTVDDTGALTTTEVTA